MDAFLKYIEGLDVYPTNFIFFSIFKSFINFFKKNNPFKFEITFFYVIENILLPFPN